MLDPIVPQPPQLPSRRRSPTRERAPAPTDIAERMIAFQRKTAGLNRSRDRPERADRNPTTSPSQVDAQPQPSGSRERLPAARPVAGPSSPRRQAPPTSPRVVVSPADSLPAEEFSRRLRLTEGGAARPTRPAPPTDASRKLYNPHADARRTAEPEAMSDAASSAYVSRGSGSGTPAAAQRDAPSGHRQLFDHRKDDPVRFSVLARPGGPGGRPTPTPKSSVDYSASSVSSYAPSFASSSFTLSSTTDGGSSAGSNLEGGGPREDPGSANAFSAQLKRLYRAITALEAKIIHEDALENTEDVRVVLRGARDAPANEEAERERWAKTTGDHKRLAEMMHNLLEISLAPSVPASLRNIPEKYNIISRLWTNAFHKLLEGLRRASCAQQDLAAFEHLQEFIYYAYTFYTNLLEERTLDSFKSNWLEALGDLARYGMAVAAMVTNQTAASPGFTLADVRNAVKSDDSKAPSAEGSMVSERPARIDDSPVPSVGIAAARALEVEPEKERWRHIARDWYFAGIATRPVAGKLHHHLGLLSRELEGDELRGVYHFTKSMTALHPFPTARESVLPLWSIQSQARRQQPDARASELFVLLHGMLFTNIQLDDFQPTLARFMERLEIEGAEEREWIMMAVVNISAVLEYGKPTGVVRRTGGGGVPAPSGPRMKLAARKDDDQMDVDDAPMVIAIQASPTSAKVVAASEQPAAFKLAIQLAFTMLAYTLRRPTRKPSPYARSTLNPYNTVLLTFLTTVARQPGTLAELERFVPWADLAAFLTGVPRAALAQADGAAMLTSGCAPLDEDWCLRGMEWLGRRVYERGFWKGGDERRAELDVLDRGEGAPDGAADGIIEDEEEDGHGGANRARGTSRRWVRLARAGVMLAKVSGGLVRAEGSREWRVEGELARKVEMWEEEDRVAREEEERRLRGTRWDDDEMAIDEGGVDGEEESEEDENDSEEIKALKARRRYLRSLELARETDAMVESPIPRPPRVRASRKPANASGPSLKLVAGYTVLVLDTNVLLSSLDQVSALIQSLCWTVVVPLPVVMELEGLSAAPGALGAAAAAAFAAVGAHMRAHGASLKVLTSRGNYLPNLAVRTERVEFGAGAAAWERSMDDLILRTAVWQDEHWADRAALLKAPPADTQGAAKVVLLSLDRNLRLKARARQLAAANEKDLAAVLAAAA